MRYLKKANELILLDSKARVDLLKKVMNAMIEQLDEYGEPSSRAAVTNVSLNVGIGDDGKPYVDTEVEFADDNAAYNQYRWYEEGIGLAIDDMGMKLRRPLTHVCPDDEVKQD